MALKGHRSVRRRLRKPYYCQLGAHTGCGCGFLSDEDGEDAEQRAAALAALRCFLERAVRAGDAELLVCWIGDEDKEADAISMSPSEIEALDFDSTWEKPLRISLRA